MMVVVGRSGCLRQRAELHERGDEQVRETGELYLLHVAPPVQRERGRRCAEAEACLAERERELSVVRRRTESETKSERGAREVADLMAPRRAAGAVEPDGGGAAKEELRCEEWEGVRGPALARVEVGAQ